MPVAQTQQEKYIAGIKVDKETDECFYNDETHSYYDKKTLQKGISVTTLVSKYCNEFDSAFWSAAKAMEKLLTPEDWAGLKPLLHNTRRWKDSLLEVYGIKKELFDMVRQEILDEWERKKNEACIKGTAKHLEKELSFYNRDTYDFAKYGAPEHKGSFVCHQDEYNMDIERGVFPEFLVSYVSPDGELRIMGQADCVIKDGNELSCLDWKTNAEIKKKGYYDPRKKKVMMMKYPLNNLEDTTWNHYQMQLSCYAWMFEQRMPGITIKHLNIVHLKDDGSEVIMPCQYLKAEVERMIKHYKKNSKVVEALERCKPIEY